MSLEFGAAEILQRTKDDQTRPAIQFDIARWAYLKKAGSQSTTLVDVQAAGTNVTRFQAPRAGLYRILASMSCGVAATPRIVRILAQSGAGSALWEHRFTLTSGGRVFLDLHELYFDDGDIIDCTLVTAMVLGDDMTGSVTNWELVG